MLDVDQLEVAYDGTTAVDRVDLDVADGEVVVLLGPSGCGKSSILRAVAGLVAVRSGRVAIAGEDVSGVAPERRHVGLMFQDYALFPHLDAIGNVMFGPRMAGAARGAAAERAREVLRMVRLDGFEHRRIDALSGGEQQRVALARALAPSPRLLLLDEPLGSLDRGLREALAVELRELFTALGASVLAVTHDQSEAFTMADRVVLLRAGRVVQQGAPAVVWERPADAWTARFLGYANVLAVEVRRGAAATPWGPVPTDRPDGAAALVLRPAALTLDPSGQPGTAGHPRFRGDHVAVPVRVSGVDLEVLVRSGAVPERGQAVGVALDPSAALAVDP